MKQSRNNIIHRNIQQDITESLLIIKSKVQQKLVTIFNDITIHLWNSKMEDGLDKIRNKICEETLNLDDTIDIGKATSDGIQKEKFLPQGTVHQIARNEARQQFKREFQRLKNKVIPSKKSEKPTENQSKKPTQHNRSTTTTTNMSNTAPSTTNINRENKSARKINHQNHNNNNNDKSNRNKKHRHQNDTNTSATSNHPPHQQQNKIEEANR